MTAVALGDIDDHAACGLARSRHLGQHGLDGQATGSTGDRIRADIGGHVGRLCRACDGTGFEAGLLREAAHQRNRDHLRRSGKDERRRGNRSEDASGCRRSNRCGTRTLGLPQRVAGQGGGVVAAGIRARGDALLRRTGRYQRVGQGTDAATGEREVEVDRARDAVLRNREGDIEARAASEAGDWLESRRNHLLATCRVGHQSRRIQRHRNTILEDAELDDRLAVDDGNAADLVAERSHARCNGSIVGRRDVGPVRQCNSGSRMAGDAGAVVGLRAADSVEAMARRRSSSRGAQTGCKVDAIVAGAASQAARHILPVVAIGGLDGLQRVGLCITVVALGAIAAVLREAVGIERHGGLCSSSGIEVVTRQGQFVAHVHFVDHARVIAYSPVIYDGLIGTL